ncbi:MAG: prepilin-type N-terminal cleavage/methylation domain-containing protein [Lachnospiraceae bacterium]|nr:prepilin-type N-terminal cleavage/methylation domain-containing protein [Lachnospiraceae bacterium]
MKQNNKGYSLVEIIIVIAIMAILTGGVFFSINMVFGANAKTCANDLKNAISQCKVNTMGKSDAALEIYRDSSNQCIYARQWIKESYGWQAKEPEKISNAKVYITYSTDGTNFQELDGTKSLYIGFDRSSGSFKEGTNPNSGMVDPIYSGFFVGGGGRKYDIELVKLTGKVNVEAGVDK